MEHGHDDLQGRLVHFFVLVDGDASSVVLHGDGVIFVDGDFYVGAVACHGFVDGVVHRLVDQVVQAFLADVADVHSRTLAHGLKTFEHLYVTG